MNIHAQTSELVLDVQNQKIQISLNPVNQSLNSGLINCPVLVIPNVFLPPPKPQSIHTGEGFENNIFFNCSVVLTNSGFLSGQTFSKAIMDRETHFYIQSTTDGNVSHQRTLSDAVQGKIHHDWT